MNRSALFRIAAAATLATAAAPMAQVALPTGFDGIYVPEGEACGTGLEITVEKGEMLVMDGAMLITDLIENPTNPRQVEARLEISAGGEVINDFAVMTLAEDGKSLRFDFEDGSSVIWDRCD